MDFEQKKNDVIAFVKKGVSYFYSQGAEKTFCAIQSGDADFVLGDLYLFAFDFDGICKGSGGDKGLYGQALLRLRDEEGICFVKDLIEMAKSGGGWVEYIWEYAPKLSYVEKVQDKATGALYLIGAGFYPPSKMCQTKGLVDRAVDYFNQYGAQIAFALFSYELGGFIIGDLYIFAYDYDGKCMGIGKFKEMIGKNFIDSKDESGVYFIKAMISTAKNGGGWVAYRWKGAKKVSYVREIEDKETGKKYFIGSGFYPDSKAEIPV